MMSHLFRLSALVLALALASPPPASAQQGVVQLSSEDEATLRQIEDYLGGIDSLDARFLQVSSNGDTAEGRLRLSRPGHLRIDYEPPMPVVIVANNEYVSYFDTELQQVSHFDIDNTPLGILLRDDFRFSDGKVTVTRFERGPGVVRVSVIKTDDPFEGRLTLVFSERPLELRKWSVIDPQGILTEVTLTDTRYGVDLSDSVFEFRLRTLDRNER